MSKCKQGTCLIALYFYFSAKIVTLEILDLLLKLITDTKDTLAAITREYRTWTYLILFIIIFAETGFVVTPFLPGDSLLFAMGALIAAGDTGLHIWYMALLLSAAAILGNTLNYRLGRYFGVKVFKEENKILKLKYYHQSHEYFEKHGSKAVVFSRFLPIFRTIAPFVAGAARMSFGRFTFYNFVGGIAWIFSLLFAGYLLGKMPFIERNFELVIVAIALGTFAPVVWAAIKPLFKKKTEVSEEN
ncbi:VTT domain-containing protein [Pedobacter montanisoli]|uniref:VTT domain-containing protein n=1 Tax=Pedobacter montanisoli TaxID=2923277 RepID=UPI00293E0935|nr:VTT domain-containing protein [Pedobacter montanisoli]